MTPEVWVSVSSYTWYKQQCIPESGASKTPANIERIGHMRQGHHPAVRMNDVDDTKLRNPNFNAVERPSTKWVLNYVRFVPTRATAGPVGSAPRTSPRGLGVRLSTMQ